MGKNYCKLKQGNCDGKKVRFVARRKSFLAFGERSVEDGIRETWPSAPMLENNVNH